jgi:hypothetical protein
MDDVAGLIATYLSEGDLWKLVDVTQPVQPAQSESLQEAMARGAYAALVRRGCYYHVYRPGAGDERIAAAPVYYPFVASSSWPAGVVRKVRISPPLAFPLESKHYMRFKGELGADAIRSLKEGPVTQLDDGHFLRPVGLWLTGEMTNEYYYHSGLRSLKLFRAVQNWESPPEDFTALTSLSFPTQSIRSIRAVAGLTSLVKLQVDYYGSLNGQRLEVDFTALRLLRSLKFYGTTTISLAPDAALIRLSLCNAALKEAPPLTLRKLSIKNREMIDEKQLHSLTGLLSLSWHWNFIGARAISVQALHTLTSLKIGFRHHLSHSLPCAAGGPVLRRLEIGCLSAGDTWFPSSLTSLSIGLRRQNQWKMDFSLLDLTSLTVDGCLAPDSNVYLLTNLTRLDLRLENECAARFPPNITSLVAKYSPGIQSLTKLRDLITRYNPDVARIIRPPVRYIRFHQLIVGPDVMEILNGLARRHGVEIDC